MKKKHVTVIHQAPRTVSVTQTMENVVAMKIRQAKNVTGVFQAFLDSLTVKSVNAMAIPMNVHRLAFAKTARSIQLENSAKNARMDTLDCRVKEYLAKSVLVLAQTEPTLPTHAFITIKLDMKCAIVCPATQETIAKNVRSFISVSLVKLMVPVSFVNVMVILTQMILKAVI